MTPEPDEIELRQTGPNEWAFRTEHHDQRALVVPEKVETKRRKSPVDDIPNLGSPVEFFTIVACMFLYAYLTR